MDAFSARPRLLSACLSCAGAKSIWPKRGGSKKQFSQLLIKSIKKSDMQFSQSASSHKFSSWPKSEKLSILVRSYFNDITIANQEGCEASVEAECK